MTVREENGEITWFSVTGHSGQAVVGEDVVCAAVSALVINAVNSCEALLGVPLQATDDGSYLECTVQSSAHAESVQLLLRSMLYGVEQTAAVYPRHVAVRHDR